MTWTVKNFSGGDGWHRSAGFNAHFLESFKSRFSPCRYRFEYDLESCPANYARLCLVHKDIILNGLEVWEWIEFRAKGNIYMTANCQDHIVSDMSQGRIETVRTTLAIEFSDRKLAILWKLSWGGKMVDSYKRYRISKV